MRVSSIHSNAARHCCCSWSDAGWLPRARVLQRERESDVPVFCEEDEDVDQAAHLSLTRRTQYFRSSAAMTDSTTNPQTRRLDPAIVLHDVSRSPIPLLIQTTSSLTSVGTAATDRRPIKTKTHRSESPAERKGNFANTFGSIHETRSPLYRKLGLSFWCNFVSIGRQHAARQRRNNCSNIPL